jgi:hypothetical protein
MILAPLAHTGPILKLGTGADISPQFLQEIFQITSRASSWVLPDFVGLSGLLAAVEKDVVGSGHVSVWNEASCRGRHFRFMTVMSGFNNSLRYFVSPIRMGKHRYVSFCKTKREVKGQL